MEYHFGPYQLDVQRKLLYREDELLETESRILQLLELLLKRYPETISRRELMETLWPNQEISDWALSQLIRRARLLLGDDGRNPSFIKTIHGVGVRFLVSPHKTDNTALRAESTGTPKKKKYLITALLTILVVAGLFLLYFYSSPQHDNPLRDISGYPYTIALLPIENNSTDPTDAWIELGMMDILGQLLRESAGIQVLDSRATLDFLEDNALEGPYSPTQQTTQLFDRICPALGCQVLLAARIDDLPDGLRMSYQLATTRGLYPPRSLTAASAMDAANDLARQISRWIDPSQPWALDSRITFSADEAANTAYAMGAQELLNGDARSAAQYLEIALGKTADFPWAQVRLAEARYRLNELDEASRLINTLLQQSKLSPDIYYHVLRIQSNLLYARGKLEASRALSQQLLKLAQASGDLVKQGAQLMNIGTSYQASGDNSRALQYLLDAENAYRQARYKPGIGATLFNIGNVHTGLTAYDQAASYYRQAELIFRQLGNRQYLAMTGFQQANLLKSTQQYEKARRKLAELLPLFDRLGDREGVALVRIDVAEIDLLEGRTEAGIQRLKELLPELQAQQLSYPEYLLHGHLANAYLSNDQPELAREHVFTESEYQATDPNTALLPARLAYAEKRFQTAFELARQVKQQAGPAWKPRHQELLNRYMQATSRPDTSPVLSKKTSL